MDKKMLVMAAMMLAAGVFVLTRSKNMTMPSDFRDAVMDQLPVHDNAEMAVPAPKAAKAESSAGEAGDLTSLIGTYLEFKQEMESVEISLSGEYGNSVPTESRFQEALSQLQKCREIAQKFRANSAQAISNTPKNRETIASVKLLLMDIGEVTSDNDIPSPALRYLVDIGKKSKELERRTKPHVDLMYKIIGEFTDSIGPLRVFAGG
jgi:hypothetical protein